MNIPRTAVRVLLAMSMILAATQNATAQRRANRTQQDSPIAEMVQVLVLEASEMKSGLRLPTEQPDFANRTSLTADPEDIGLAIVSTHHKDVLIDAYVRWQLTSFKKAALPELDDRAFQQAIRSLPRLLENPRAQGDVIGLFERAEKQRRVSASDRERLEEMNRELQKRSALVEPYNLPAIGLREWLLEQCGETGIRQHMVRIEWCAATIAGGWPTRAVKTEMTKAMADAGADETISGRDRMRLAGMVGDLDGMSRRLVREVAFMADGSVEVGFSTAQVTSDDVKRWTDRLLGVTNASR